MTLFRWFFLFFTSFYQDACHGGEILPLRQVGNYHTTDIPDEY